MNAPAQRPGDPLRNRLLGELRCASLRARLATAEIDYVGAMLKDRLISPFDALAMLHESEARPYFKITEPEKAA